MGPFLLILAVLGVSIPRAYPSTYVTQSGTAAVAAPQVLAVELFKSLDSGKLKVGHQVLATVLTNETIGKVDIGRGSRMIGHVIETKARSKGDGESTLGIVFDKLKVQGGTEMDMKLVVLAVAPNPALIAGDRGGHVDYTDITDFPVYGTVPSQRGKAVPMLTEQSRGVMGFKDLQLGPDGVLTSSEKEVKLDAGTQMLLGVEKP